MVWDLRNARAPEKVHRLDLVNGWAEFFPRFLLGTKKVFSHSRGVNKMPISFFRAERTTARYVGTHKRPKSSGRCVVSIRTQFDI